MIGQQCARNERALDADDDGASRLICGRTAAPIRYWARPQTCRWWAGWLAELNGPSPLSQEDVVPGVSIGERARARTRRRAVWTMLEPGTWRASEAPSRRSDQRRLKKMSRHALLACTPTDGRSSSRGAAGRRSEGARWPAHSRQGQRPAVRPLAARVCGCGRIAALAAV